MKIVSINTESVPIGTKVTFYFGDPDVDVLSALAHIRATQIGGLTNGISGSLDEVNGAGATDGGLPHGQDAVGREDTVVATVEPSPKTRSRRSRSGRKGAVGDDAETSSEQTPAPEEKKERRKRRARSEQDDKHDSGSGVNAADDGSDRRAHRSRGGLKPDVTSHQMTAEDLMKAAGEAADSIGPSAVMGIITGFGHDSASDIPADKRAEVAAKLIEACK